MSHVRRDWFVALGTELRGQLPGPSVLSHYTACRHHLSWVEHASPSSISLGKVIAPPSGLPVEPPYGASALLRI